MATVDKMHNVTDKEVMLKELSYQNDIFSEPDEAKRRSQAARLNKKLLATNTLKVFVVNVGGILRLVHSLKRYEGEMDEESEFDEGVIGWVGDRTHKRDPKVVLIDGAAFLWKKVSVFSSETAYTTFYSDKANRKRFYYPTDQDSLTDFVLPQLLLVPSAMLTWLLAAPRTP